MAITKIQSNAFPTSIDLSNIDLTIGANEIVTANIADSAVHTNKIADIAVTHAKLHTDMDLSGKTVTLPSLSGTLVVDGGNTNNTDDAAVFKGTGSEHIKLLLDTSSTGGHRASIALESNSNEVNIATTGSDEIRFRTSSTNDAMFIKSDGNVGIGTASPSYKLDVSGEVRTTSNFRANGTIFSNRSGNSTTSPNLFLGPTTNNATRWYSIRGTQYAHSSEGEGYGLIGGVSNASDNEVRVGGGLAEENASTMIRFFTAADTSTRGGTERIRITSAGNVGIGTTSPDAKLHIEATNPKIRLLNNSTGQSGLEWWNDYSTGVDHINAGINWNEGSANWEFKSYRADSQAGNPYGNIDFFNGSETSPTLALRITTSNNVGIGMSSPTAKLQVGTNANSTDWSDRIIFGGTSASTIDSTISNAGGGTGTARARVWIAGGGEGQAGLGFLNGDSGGTGGTISMVGGYMKIAGKDNVERMRIDMSGDGDVRIMGETAVGTAGSGTTGNSNGLALYTAGGTSCPIYFGSERDSAQKSMYMIGYWIYLRGHQNEGIRFLFSQGAGSAPRSDHYQFKYNSALRPGGSNSWDGFSDVRAKENVRNITGALDKINQLRPVMFDWTNDYADNQNMWNLDKSSPNSYEWISVKENGYDLERKNDQIGFIAQEFEQVFPKDIKEHEVTLGDETITDFKTLNTDSLIPVLTKAIQELKQENDNLKARLDAAGL